MASSRYGAQRSQPPLLFPPNKKAKILPNGDKEHPCGCVTYWQHWSPSFDKKSGKVTEPKQPPVVYYRKACNAHKAYAKKL